jgi:hypothetical protein
MSFQAESFQAESFQAESFQAESFQADFVQILCAIGQRKVAKSNPFDSRIPSILATPNYHRTLKHKSETPADNLVIRRGHIHVPTSDTVQLGK